MSGLRVAVVSNRKYQVRVEADAPPDALAEYDSEVTVESIQAVLREAGHEAFFLEADEAFFDAVREARPDICFNIAEGLRGDSRESHIPAILEMLGIPYTGARVLANALALDKAAAKMVWRESGLPTAPFQLFSYAEAPLAPDMSFPLFVKPVHEGSGMGINARSIVHDVAELRAQAAWVISTYRQPALVETFLPGREFTVGLIGNTLFPGQAPRSAFYNARGFHLFPVLELDTQRGAVKGIYNAEAKSYALDDANAPGYLCPAEIPDALRETLFDMTMLAFEALGGLDLGRVDFRLGADGQPYIVEINLLPGLNPLVSDMIIVSRTGGVPYEFLINEVLNLARERYRI
ncbi:MAG: hypothetical protein JW892_12350 [Anaerolineae bacterium]|nr:hypothetical protein [Anaerolineae bacterium]